jgi:uncharacterized Zn-finger protein
MSTADLKSETTSKYSCPECNKTFKEKGNLKTHIRKHVRIKYKPRLAKNPSVVKFVVNASALKEI